MSRISQTKARYLTGSALQERKQDDRYRDPISQRQRWLGRRCARNIRKEPHRRRAESRTHGRKVFEQIGGEALHEGRGVGVEVVGPVV